MPGPIAPTIYPPAMTLAAGDNTINFAASSPYPGLVRGIRVNNNTINVTITVAYDTPASAGVGLPMTPGQMLRDDTPFGVLHIYCPTAGVMFNGPTAGISAVGITSVGIY